jgi:hypothetical protein
MLIVEDEDGYPTYADTEGAAELLGQAGIVNAYNLICHWKAIGLLAPVATAGRRPVYRMADVDAAETAARKAATRSGGRPRLTGLTGGLSSGIGREQIRPKSPASMPGVATSGGR